MQTSMIGLVAAASMALGATSIAHAGTASLDFDKTFNAKSAPRAAHFRAQYRTAGKTHELEVWRDRDLSLRRRTDDAIETYVRRPADDPEWRMVVLDLHQKIRTDIDRTNLYRVGHFVDWFGMAHGLARPVGAYDLHKVAAPAGMQPALASCHWYRLSNQGRTSDICWSQAMRLPLLIATPDGQVQWRVTEANADRIASTTFDIHDAGFARNDANSDISTD